jgi:hypothetical protein
MHEQIEAVLAQLTQIEKDLLGRILGQSQAEGTLANEGFAEAMSEALVKIEVWRKYATEAEERRSKENVQEAKPMLTGEQAYELYWTACNTSVPNNFEDLPSDQGAKWILFAQLLRGALV